MITVSVLNVPLNAEVENFPTKLLQLIHIFLAENIKPVLE
jgi:hypothetical protein